MSDKLFSCEECSKTFTRKDNLQRHLRAHCKENILICDECQKNFTRRDVLKEHLLTHQRQEIIECSECKRHFKSKITLLKHLCDQHGFIDNYGCLYECDACSLKFSGKQKLKRHIENVHSTRNVEQSNEKVSQLRCLHCHKGNFKRRGILQHHYKTCHNIEMEYEHLLFKSLDEFENWHRSCSHYVRVNRRQTSINTVQLFRCHRSGMYRSRCKTSKRQRHLKMVGSKKLQGFCPSEMTVWQRNVDGLCVVTWQKVHVGHEISDPAEMKYTRLSESQKIEIAQQLSAGMSKEFILQLVINNYEGTVENDRPSVLKYGDDFGNISVSVGLRDPCDTENDPDFVDAFVSKNPSSVLFYKKPGEIGDSFEDWEKDDFVLIFQDDYQRETLLEYDSKIFILDANHDPNNFLLLSLLVLDLDYKGLPVAFLFSNRGDKLVVDFFFNCIKRQVGIIRAEIIMTDTDPVYWHSWCDIMDVPNFRLFSTWHVQRAWKTQLDRLVTAADCQLEKFNAEVNGKSKFEIRRNVIKNASRKLKDLVNEIDETVFEEKLDEFIRTQMPVMPTFVTYFQKNYLNNKKCWASCYHYHAGVNCNPHVESFHRILKHKFGKGKKIETLTAGIYCVAEYLKYRNYQTKMADIRPKISPKLRALRRRHKDADQLIAEKQPFTVYCVDSKTWYVGSCAEPSEGVMEMFVIQKKEFKECSSNEGNCRLTCQYCRSCFHDYRCSCHDSAVRNNMCKHIHALCLSLNGQENSEVIYQPEVEEENTSEPVSSDEFIISSFVTSTESDIPMQNAGATLKAKIHDMFVELENVVVKKVTYENESCWLEMWNQWMQSVSLIDADTKPKK